MSSKKSATDFYIFRKNINNQAVSTVPASGSAVSDQPKPAQRFRFNLFVTLMIIIITSVFGASYQTYQSHQTYKSKLAVESINMQSLDVINEIGNISSRNSKHLATLVPFYTGHKELTLENLKYTIVNWPETVAPECTTALRALEFLVYLDNDIQSNYDSNVKTVSEYFKGTYGASTDEYVYVRSKRDSEMSKDMEYMRIQLKGLVNVMRKTLNLFKILHGKDLNYSAEFMDIVSGTFETMIETQTTMYVVRSEATVLQLMKGLNRFVGVDEKNTYDIVLDVDIDEDDKYLSLTNLNINREYETTVNHTDDAQWKFAFREGAICQTATIFEKIMSSILPNIDPKENTTQLLEIIYDAVGYTKSDIRRVKELPIRAEINRSIIGVKCDIRVKVLYRNLLKNLIIELKKTINVPIKALDDIRSKVQVDPSAILLLDLIDKVVAKPYVRIESRELNDMAEKLRIPVPWYCSIATILHHPICYANTRRSFSDWNVGDVEREQINPEL